MVNYELGKIYKIIGNGSNKCYIGSTTKKYLSYRFSCHTSKYRSNNEPYSSKIIFDESGLENCSIILIENFPCKSKDELKARERHWIENTVDCINKNIPNRTKKEYIEANKEVLQKKWKEYREKNKDSIAQKKKEKKYYLNYNDVITCECGHSYKRNHKSQHMKTKKHLNNLPIHCS